MTGLIARLGMRSPAMRTGLSIGGIALCILLMLFLLGAYRGVEEGSMEFIHRNGTDLWVLHGSATNILRCTSIRRYEDMKTIGSIRGVQSVAPLLLILANVDREDGPATVYLAGFLPQTGKGGPPRIVAGRNVETDGETVLDQAFARKHRLTVGDTVTLQGQRLVMVGESAGTNAFVIQYAFVTLRQAWQLAGYPGIVTCFLVDLDHTRPSEEVEDEILARLPGSTVYPHAAFVRNNLAEMQAGFLPFVYTIAVFGAAVLTAILSLLLSLSIAERRRDFAVMKILGAPGPYMWLLVIRQALYISGMGTIVAAIVSPGLIALVGRLSPEVTILVTPLQIVQVAFAALTVGIVSALIAMIKLRRIYPMEAF